MASNFVAGNATFGVRETASILEKITWGLAVVILALSVCTSFMIRSNKSEEKAQAEAMAKEAAAEQAGIPEMPTSEVEATTEAEAE